MKKLTTVIKIILGKIVYYFSGWVPRNNKIWAFGSFGVFNDNSKYLFLNCQDRDEIKPVWISRNKKSVDLAREYGLSYYYLSPMGIYYSLKSGVYIYSSYLSDINYYTSKGCCKVNLWHGIPLKKIEFDINSLPLVSTFKKAGRLKKFVYAAQHEKPDLVLSPSEYVSDYSFVSAFRVNKKDIIHARYPRVTELIECPPMILDRGYQKIFLYAPTWRDNGKDFINESGINFSTLDELLQSNNSLLLLKLHPSTKIKFNSSVFGNIKIVDNQIDPITVMKTADCLITDYSSIYFDYLYLNRPIIFFCFDLAPYMNNREMYFEYNEVTPGLIASDANMLYQCLDEIINNKDTYTTQRTECFNKFALKEQGNDIIIQAIKEKINS